MVDYIHNDDLPKSLEGIDVSDAALIVIDELGEVEGGPLEDVLLQPTLNSARLAACAREHGIPVIFANDAHIKGLDRELELWGDHGIAGSEEARVSHQLELQEGDFVIEKRRYSAFFQTSLLLLLDELGKKTLIICGFDTNICVQHTAADAYFNNFSLVIASDATATFLVGTQEAGLAYMQTCYAARVATTDQIISAIVSQA